MNYRHIYHAGNFADVFKHIMLMLVLDYLRQKDRPFFVLDTHAGIGLYDLESEEAKKTGEAMGGIGRLWECTDIPPLVQPYMALLKRINARQKNRLRYYPGSPLIAREMLRPDDRLVANELHPDDVKTLTKNLGRDRRVKTENVDGYIMLKAQLPPQERRGVALVDPPFEVRDEFERMVTGLEEAYKRWATGIYMLWYPIKDPAPVAAFHRALADTGIPRINVFSFMKFATPLPDRFNGCGLAIVNPPWKLTEQMAAIGPWLVKIMSDAEPACYETAEISGEAA